MSTKDSTKHSTKLTTQDHQTMEPFPPPPRMRKHHHHNIDPDLSPLKSHLPTTILSPTATIGSIARPVPPPTPAAPHAQALIPELINFDSDSDSDVDDDDPQTSYDIDQLKSTDKSTPHLRNPFDLIDPLDYSSDSDSDSDSDHRNPHNAFETVGNTLPVALEVHRGAAHVLSATIKPTHGLDVVTIVDMKERMLKFVTARRSIESPGNGEGGRGLIVGMTSVRAPGRYEWALGRVIDDGVVSGEWKCVWPAAETTLPEGLRECAVEIVVEEGDYGVGWEKGWVRPGMPF